MKKIYILLLFLTVAFRGWSQSSGPDTTLQSPNFSPGNVIIYGEPGGGYLTGTGQFNEFYQKYSLANYALLLGLQIDQPVWIDKVYLLYSVKKMGATPGFVKSKVYNVVYNAEANLNASSVPTPGYGPDPNGPIGTSDSISMANISTPVSTLLEIPFNYATPVPITDDSFFVSIALSNNDGDTIGISSTKASANMPPSYNGPPPPFPMSSWMSISDGTNSLFYDYNYLLNASGLLGADLDLGIFPHLIHKLPSGVKDVNNDELFVMPFPNPSTSELYLSYDISKNETVKVSLTDLLGRKVIDMGTKNQSQGAHIETLDVSGLTEGIYLYKVETLYGEKTGKIYVKH